MEKIRNPGKKFLSKTHKGGKRFLYSWSEAKLCNVSSIHEVSECGFGSFDTRVQWRVTVNTVTSHRAPRIAASVVSGLLTVSFSKSLCCYVIPLLAIEP